MRNLYLSILFCGTGTFVLLLILSLTFSQVIPHSSFVVYLYGFLACFIAVVLSSSLLLKLEGESVFSLFFIYVVSMTPIIVFSSFSLFIFFIFVYVVFLLPVFLTQKTIQTTLTRLNKDLSSMRYIFLQKKRQKEDCHLHVKKLSHKVIFQKKIIEMTKEFHLKKESFFKNKENMLLFINNFFQETALLKMDFLEPSFLEEESQEKKSFDEHRHLRYQQKNTFVECIPLRIQGERVGVIRAQFSIEQEEDLVLSLTTLFHLFYLYHLSVQKKVTYKDFFIPNCLSLQYFDEYFLNISRMSEQGGSCVYIQLCDFETYCLNYGFLFIDQLDRLIASKFPLAFPSSFLAKREKRGEFFVVFPDCYLDQVMSFCQSLMDILDQVVVKRRGSEIRFSVNMSLHYNAHLNLDDVPLMCAEKERRFSRFNATKEEGQICS